MAIVSTAEIQTALQVTLTGTQLAMLNFIHPLVEGVFKSWLGGQTEYGQVTEILPSGRGHDREPLLEDASRQGARVVLSPRVGGFDTIQLTHLPVWESGLALYEDLDAKGGAASGAFAVDTLLTYGEDYWLDVNDDDNRISQSGLLYRASAWSQYPGTIKVTYFGGETAARLVDSGAAAHIKAGALICHLHAYKAIAQLAGKSGKAKAVTAENIGKYSYSSPEGLALATSIVNFGVPLAAQEAAFKAKNMAVFG